MDSLLKKYEIKTEECEQKICERHLQQISSGCCKNWKRLHPHLKIDKVIVSDIDSKSVDGEEKRLDFFQRWVMQEGSDATYSKLIEALLATKNREDAEYVCMLLINEKRNKEVSTTSKASGSLPPELKVASPPVDPPVTTSKASSSLPLEPKVTSPPDPPVVKGKINLR